MDPVQEANARLRDLGYDEADARVEWDGSEALRIAGGLLGETTADPPAMLRLLLMLPGKNELLAYRHAADSGPLAPDPDVIRCAWCGRLRRNGAWDADAPVADSQPAVGSHGMCPACFESNAAGL